MSVERKVNVSIGESYEKFSNRSFCHGESVAQLNDVPGIPMNLGPPKVKVERVFKGEAGSDFARIIEGLVPER